MDTYYSCAMFIMIDGKCLTVRFPHLSIMLILCACHMCVHRKWVFHCEISKSVHCANSPCVPCLWLQYVSAWLPGLYIHPLCSFCFCAIFVITGSESLIVRFTHPSILTILLLCHVCDYSMWVLDCQSSISIHFDYSASIQCLWVQDVSAW